MTKFISCTLLIVFFLGVTNPPTLGELDEATDYAEQEALIIATSEEQIPMEPVKSIPIPDDIFFTEESYNEVDEEELLPELDDIIDTIPVAGEYMPVYITITEDEREMLARLVYLEAGICSQECQRAIASVVLNRLSSGRWTQDMNWDGNITIYDIIYFPLAFSPAYNIPYATPSESCYEAVDYVITYGPTLPCEVRYFRLAYDFNWYNYIPYCELDNVYFGYLSNWEEGAW